MTCTEILISKWVWWLWWRRQSKIKSSKEIWKYWFRQQKTQKSQEIQQYFDFNVVLTSTTLSLDFRLLFLKLIESCRHFLEPKRIYDFLSVTFTPYYVTWPRLCYVCRREFVVLWNFTFSPNWLISPVKVTGHLWKEGRNRFRNLKDPSIQWSKEEC